MIVRLLVLALLLKWAFAVGYLKAQVDLWGV